MFDSHLPYSHNVHGRSIIHFLKTDIFLVSQETYDKTGPIELNTIWLKLLGISTEFPL